MLLQGKMRVLSEITDIILETMKIVIISHTDKYVIVVEKFDRNCTSRISELCEKNGLKWVVIPYPYYVNQYRKGFPQTTYKKDRIGAKLILEDPTQTEITIPSLGGKEEVCIGVI